MLMLCTGAVQLTRSLSGNRRALVQLGTSGKLVGEEGGQEGAVRLLTCTALTGGRAVQVSRQGTARLLEDKPLLWSYLLNSAVRRSKSLANQLCLMIDGSVEMRLARLVLRLADELGLPDARGPFVPYNLSRRDLAGTASCGRARSGRGPSSGSASPRSPPSAEVPDETATGASGQSGSRDRSTAAAPLVVRKGGRSRNGRRRRRTRS